MQTSKDDVLIILGDAGINYYGPEQDKRKKKYLESLPITIFAIHGNHEMRPQTISTYHEADWNGGKVYMEDDYPHILFAKDAELYELNGLFTFVVGGAYSVDKNYRLLHGLAWWPDEQPSDEIKRQVEEKLEGMDWEVDVVLTCAAPNLRERPSNEMNAGDGDAAVHISREDLQALHEKRMRRVLEIAWAKGNEVVILGAFGCGAFRNPSAVVAQAMKTVVKEYRMRFETIEFAVYCTTQYDTNYRVFQQVLGGM